VTAHPLPGERFPRRRLKLGYNVEDVDALLARAELGGLTATEIAKTKFGSGYGGYDESSVDDELDALSARLTAQGLGGSDAQAPAGTDATGPQSGSWWSRLLSKSSQRDS
jgi:DivIVA domain-containing protein